MSFTLNELALLLIALVVGWLLGLMMSGRGKYHRLYRDEEIAHRNAVKERDAALRERDARIEAANVRIAELERQSGPIGPGTATAVGGAVHGRRAQCGAIVAQRGRGRPRRGRRCDFE